MVNCEYKGSSINKVYKRLKYVTIINGSINTGLYPWDFDKINADIQIIGDWASTANRYSYYNSFYGITLFGASLKKLMILAANSSTYGIPLLQFGSYGRLTIRPVYDSGELAGYEYFPISQIPQKKFQIQAILRHKRDEISSAYSLSFIYENSEGIVVTKTPYEGTNEIESDYALEYIPTEIKTTLKDGYRIRHLHNRHGFDMIRPLSLFKNPITTNSTNANAITILTPSSGLNKTNGFKGRIYSFSIYKATSNYDYEKILDLIPYTCTYYNSLDNSLICEEVGFMDMVKNEFLTSKKNEWIKGPYAE